MVVTAEPRIRGTFEPTIVDSRPPIGLKMISAIVVGTRYRPDWVTEAPKP